MSISLDELKDLLTQHKVRYFVDPDHDALLGLFGGYHGSYKVVFEVDLDGTFLQLKTLGYVQCPTTHPHCRVVLELLGLLNYSYRSTKFAWDPRDGEIVGYVDLWLEDARVTLLQLAANLGILLRTIDRAFYRLNGIMETGVDPGDPSPPTSTPADDSEFDTV